MSDVTSASRRDSSCTWPNSAEWQGSIRNVSIHRVSATAAAAPAEKGDQGLSGMLSGQDAGRRRLVSTFESAGDGTDVAISRLRLI